MTVLRPIARASALLVLFAAAGASAGAQGTKGAGASRAARPAQDPLAAPPMGALNGRALKPGTWKYTTTISAGGQTQSVPRVLTIAAAAYSARPAWLMVDVQGSGERMVVDSLYLSRDELVPIHHVIHIGPSRLAVDFTADSVVGEAESPQGTQPVRGGYSRGAMVNGPMLEAAFRVFPLRALWRATVPMLGVSPTGSQVAPVAVSVTGDETVTVPAGQFPSWVIEIGGGSGQQRLWVSKASGQIVKVTMRGAQGMTAETVMIPSR